MEKERLEELREIVWADYECVSETGGGDTRHYTDILALIDAEIVRQSATDEAVKAAIEWAELEHGYCMRYMMFGDADSATLAIDALRQYQKPTDEAVKDAISWLESDKNDRHREWERAGAEWRMEPGTQEMHDEQMDAFDLAITALQAYQLWIPVSNGKPESGKHVLLCCEIKPLGKRYVCDGFYAQSKTITTICDGDNNYEYDEETDEYYLIEGYYEVIKNWEDYSSIVIDDFVTHWIPLPKPPENDVPNTIQDSKH